MFKSKIFTRNARVKKAKRLELNKLNLSSHDLKQGANGKSSRHLTIQETMSQNHLSSFHKSSLF